MPLTGSSPLPCHILNEDITDVADTSSSSPPFTAPSPLLVLEHRRLCHHHRVGRDCPQQWDVLPISPHTWGLVTPPPQAWICSCAAPGPGALLCMDGAAFWVMKYSQVSDSLRNDGDQSIPFQGVIFFPFTASVSC